MSHTQTLTYDKGDLGGVAVLACMHGDGRVSVFGGPLTLTADADELEAWLAAGLRDLRSRRRRPDTTSGTVTRAYEDAIPGDLLVWADGDRWEIDTAERGVAHLIEADDHDADGAFFACSCGTRSRGLSYEEARRKHDAHAVEQLASDRVKLTFVGHPDPMIVTAGTLARFAVREGDEQSGEPFTAPTAISS